MVLCWQAGRGIESLVLPERSTTYHFFRALGLTPLQQALEAIAVAVALAAFTLLFAWLLAARVRLGRLERDVDALELARARAEGEPAPRPRRPLEAPAGLEEGSPRRTSPLTGAVE